MTDEKPRRPRASRPGGETPMRRRAATGAKPPEHGVRKDEQRRPRADRTRSDSSGADKTESAKPRITKPRAAVAPPAPHEKTFEGERVAKAMARAGACSRRDAEQWIAAGRVAVNGRVLASPALNVREDDVITVDGAPLQPRERTRLFLFHKPVGLVTTAKDPEGRPTVFDYLAERHPDLPRVVSIGRLDINTEGLLLLTNDGGLARELELPHTGWTRRYRVRAHGETDQAQLDELKKGVTVDGVRYLPIHAVHDRTQGANAWISMSLTEGKNREIKRVLEHLGLDVTRLIRLSFGPFQLGDIAEGAVEEVKLKVLREQLGKDLAQLAGVDFSSPLWDSAPATATEAQELRERAQKRPRKHVSVMRRERDDKDEKSPRVRIERSNAADRKGRVVAVERVVSKKLAPPETRNGRRFAAIRREEQSAAAAPRPERRADRDRKPFSPERTERPAGRPPRPDGGERFERRPPPRESKPETGERSAGARPPARSGEGRPERKQYRERAPFAGPRAERPERAPERPDRERSSARSFKAPSERWREREAGKSSAPRGDRAARAPKREESQRTSEGPRKPRGEGKSAGFSKPAGGKRSGPPRKGSPAGAPRGPRKPGGSGKPPGRGPR